MGHKNSLLSLVFPGEEESNYLLNIQGLTKKLQKSDASFQLNIPYFQVASGEFIAIVGESGCGKSTLLDLLGLISAPTKVDDYQLNLSSTLRFDVAKLWKEGADLSLAKIRHQFLGYILQTGGLLPYLSVEKNLTLSMKIKKMKVQRSHWIKAAREMGVESCLTRFPSTLSGGQRQRVAILRALLHNPRLILADEPTAAVDKRRAQAIVNDLQRLAKEENTAILMVTHDFNLVQHLYDRAYTFEVTEKGHNQIHSKLYEM